MAGNRVDGYALITGAGGGLGQEIAFTFAEAGAAGIVFADIVEEKAQAAAEKSKQLATHPKFRVATVKVDLTDPKDVENMVNLTVSEFGRIDYNINAAGVDNDVHTPISECSIDDFDKILNVNAKGVLTAVRAVSKVMLSQTNQTVSGRNGTRNIGKGSIVNIGSANCYGPVPGKTAYVTSKHAMLGITKCAALDHGADGVRVNAVCPIWVSTPMLEEELRNNPGLAGVIKAVCPLKRVAKPEEVADAVVFLCSPSASFINGTGLIIDAGMTLTVHLS